jgi:phage/conjugal plasmid C-4 type zinc finger TraR family protein
MADDADRAIDFNALALAEHRKAENLGQSRTHCLECEDPIPEKRRAAAPGCLYCIECAQELYKGFS